MDAFDIEIINNQVLQFRHDKLKLLNKIPLTSTNQANQSDILSMLLDDSPYILEENKLIQYKIPSETIIQRDTNIKPTTPSVRIESDGFNPQELKKKSTTISYSFDKMKINKENNKKHHNSQHNKNDKQESNNIEEEDDDDDDDDDEERKMKEMIRIRNERKEQSELQKEQNRLGKALTKGKINIYIFETLETIVVEVKPEDTFVQLKQRIIDNYKSAAQINENADSNQYEFKEYKKGKSLSLFNMPCIDEIKNVLSHGQPIVTFIEKAKYSSYSFAEMRRDSIITDDKLIKTGNSTKKFTLKVYLKIDINNSQSTLLQEDTENTLNEVLNKLKPKLSYKNYDYYYFVEHDPSNENSDLDDALSPNLPLKYLKTLILDLYMKKYEDDPDLFIFVQNNIPIQLMTIEKKKETTPNEDQFIYNDSSAAAYQEFSVIKINRNNKKQERILGIDLYTLYNELPKKSDNIFNMLSKKVKTNQRKIAEIEECDILTDKSFYIILRENDKTTKKLDYEVKSLAIRNQIVAKIKYLMNMQK